MCGTGTGLGVLSGGYHGLPWAWPITRPRLVRRIGSRLTPSVGSALNFFYSFANRIRSEPSAPPRHLHRRRSALGTSRPPPGRPYSARQTALRAPRTSRDLPPPFPPLFVSSRGAAVRDPLPPSVVAIFVGHGGRALLPYIFLPLSSSQARPFELPSLPSWAMRSRPKSHASSTQRALHQTHGNDNLANQGIVYTTPASFEGKT